MLFGEKGYKEFEYDEQIAKWAECAKKRVVEFLPIQLTCKSGSNARVHGLLELMSCLITQAVTLQMLNYQMFSEALWIKLI